MRTRWRPELRDLARLAVPLVLAQLAQNSMGFIDTVMVGRLGLEALAAIALGNTLFFMVLLILMAVLLSVGPFVAQAHGANDPEEAARAVGQGLWLALGLSFPGILLFMAGEQLLLWTGQEAATAAAAGDYLRVMAIGFPATLVLTALRGFLEGNGDTRPIMVVSVLGVGLNVLGNDLLMFGRWGLPELGLVGTAWASAFAYYFMAAGLAVFIAWGYPKHRVFRRLGRPDFTMMTALLRVGWPIGLTLGFETGLFSLTALLMGQFGSAALAGHQIAMQSASATFMVPLGVGIATSVRVGQAMGRRDFEGLRTSAYLGIALGGSFMLLSAVVFWTVPGAIIGLYLGAGAADSAAMVFAQQFLVVAALFQVVDGLQAVAVGSLRGLKDTRVPMVLTLVAYWLLGVPFGLVLTFVAGLGPIGLWYGMLAGLTAAAVMLLSRLVRQIRVVQRDGMRIDPAVR